MDKDKKQMFEAQLLGLRDELLQKRQEIDRAWLSLHMSQIEFEERATNEHLAAGLEQLDELEERQIEDIDFALSRLQSGQYDTCVSCGGTIAEKRLEAVPWTTRCIECAADEERKRKEFAEPAGGKPELSPEPEVRDEQLRLAVMDAIRLDGRVPTAGLTVTCENQVIRLEGMLPEKRFHSHLLQIVHDVLGRRNIEDRIRIDNMAWEREQTSGVGPEYADEDVDMSLNRK